jgi:hypothetical protein
MSCQRHAECLVVPSPRAWELDESEEICRVIGGAKPWAWGLAELPLDLERKMGHLGFPVTHL